MKKLALALFCFFAAMVSLSIEAQAQQPCQWNYSYVNNVATATYCGTVNATGGSMGTLDLSAYNGIDCTGVADSTTAVQSAVNFMNKYYYRIWVPGYCNIRLTSQITSTGWADIEGPGTQTSASTTLTVDPQPVGPGAWFHLAHTGVGFYFQPVGGITAGSFSYGNTVHGIGTYRDQPTPSLNPGVTYVPCNCDFDFSVNNAEIDFEVDIQNSTKGILENNAGKTRIRKLRGQPLAVGVYILSDFDVPVIDDMHLWPYWSGNGNVANYVLNYGIALHTGRADNLVVKRLFAYGYYKGLDVDYYPGSTSPITLPAGTLYNAQILALDCDNCYYGVVVEATTSNANFYIGSMIGASSGLAAQGTSEPIFVAGTGHIISVGDASLTFAGGSLVHNVASSSHVHINTLLAGSWNLGSTVGSPTSNPGLSANGSASDISVDSFRFTPSGAAMTLPLFGTSSYLTTLWQGALVTKFNIDTVNSAQSVAAGGTIVLPAGSGWINLRDNLAGNSCFFLIGGGVVNLVGQTAGDCSTTLTANKISVTYTGSGYTITNGYSSTAMIYVTDSRMAPFQ